MGFLKEFKEFAVKGNVVDMAVGVIIGGAFGKIVTSLVNDVVMPVIGIFTGGIDFASLFTAVNLAKLCYLGLLGSATCYMLWSSAVSKIGVLGANMYVNMVPLVTLVVSALVLDEKITLVGFAGIVLIIFGMIFASVKEK